MLSYVSLPYELSHLGVVLGMLVIALHGEAVRMKRLTTCREQRLAELVRLDLNRATLRQKWGQPAPLSTHVMEIC